MSVSTGQIIASGSGPRGERRTAPSSAAGFKTTAALATLANATACHALEFDDIATFSSHTTTRSPRPTLAVGEQLGSPGRDVILAWASGWEVICQTTKPCMAAPRNTLL